MWMWIMGVVHKLEPTHENETTCQTTGIFRAFLNSWAGWQHFGWRKRKRRRWLPNMHPTTEKLSSHDFTMQPQISSNLHGRPHFRQISCQWDQTKQRRSWVTCEMPFMSIIDLKKGQSFKGLGVDCHLPVKSNDSISLNYTTNFLLFYFIFLFGLGCSSSLFSQIFIRSVVIILSPAQV